MTVTVERKQPPVDTLPIREIVRPADGCTSWATITVKPFMIPKGATLRVDRTGAPFESGSLAGDLSPDDLIDLGRAMEELGHQLKALG